MKNSVEKIAKYRRIQTKNKKNIKNIGHIKKQEEWETSKD